MSKSKGNVNENENFNAKCFIMEIMMKGSV